MAPAQRGGVTIPRERGLPIGTPVSPLIANLVLHPLDRGLWGGERTYLRYADDFVICCADEQAAHDAMGVAQTLLEALGLTMNSQKARVVDTRAESLVFLGHLVRRAAGEAFERSIAQPALRTLYLTEPGSKLARDGRRLVVQHGGVTVASVPVGELRKIVVLAPAELTSPALVTCAEKGIDVDLMSSMGWRGRLEPAWSSNAPLRLAQALVGAEPFAAFELARAMVAGKISNQRRLLQRHAARKDGAAGADRPDLAAIANDVGRALDQVRRATTMDELRGAEGIASRRYFEGLAALLPAA